MLVNTFLRPLRGTRAAYASYAEVSIYIRVLYTGEQCRTSFIKRKDSRALHGSSRWSRDAQQELNRQNVLEKFRTQCKLNRSTIAYVLILFKYRSYLLLTRSKTLNRQPLPENESFCMDILESARTFQRIFTSYHFRVRI